MLMVIPWLFLLENASTFVAISFTGVREAKCESFAALYHPEPEFREQCLLLWIQSCFSAVFRGRLS